MTRLKIARRAFLIAAASLCVALAAAAPARAQSQDDLFDPDTIQELRLTINSRDLRDLRANFDKDTYYTADLQWRNLRVRNAGVRSRGSASRNPAQARPAGRLRPLRHRPEVSRAEVDRAEEPLAGRIDDARAHRDGLLRAHGPAGIAPVLLPPLHQQRVAGPLRASSSRSTTRFLDRTLGEHAGYLYSYQFQGAVPRRVPRRGVRAIQASVSRRRATRRKATRSSTCRSTTGCVR